MNDAPTGPTDGDIIVILMAIVGRNKDDLEAWPDLDFMD
jgi:hypothetical protein